MKVLIMFVVVLLAAPLYATEESVLSCQAATRTQASADWCVLNELHHLEYNVSKKEAKIKTLIATGSGDMGVLISYLVSVEKFHGHLNSQEAFTGILLDSLSEDRGWAREALRETNSLLRERIKYLNRIYKKMR